MSIEPMPGRRPQPGDRMPPELRWFGPDGILRGALWPTLTYRFKRRPEPAEAPADDPWHVAHDRLSEWVTAILESHDQHTRDVAWVAYRRAHDAARGDPL